MKRLVLALVLILSGCTSLETNPNATVMHEVSVPLAELRSLIVAQLPVGLSWSSDNGREVTSKYFVPGPVNTYKDGAEAATRYKAKVIILGERRPYEVEILVTAERRMLRGNVFRYATVGVDQRLTRQFVDRLKHELGKRRDDHNVIDDFRVY